MNLWQQSGAVAVGVALMAASGEAAVVRLKMADINPGTEVVNTTVSPGGGFDSHYGFNQDRPEYWQRWEEAAVSRPLINAPANAAHLGSRGAQVLPTYQAGMNPGGYARLQKINDDLFWPTDLQPNTRYVLSAYLWNFGTASDHVTARIDFTDKPNEPQFILNWDDEDAAQGYFMYASFSTNPVDPDYIGASETLRPPLRVWARDRVGYVGVADTVAAVQFDNVFITPEAQFVAPTLVPEPASLTAAGLAGAALLLRRRRFAQA